MKITKQQREAIISTAKISRETYYNWLKSKPELIQALLEYFELKKEKETSNLVKEGDYIVISGSFFDDNMQRGYKVQKGDDDRLFVLHSDGTWTYLDELPFRLYVKMDKTLFESDDNGLFL